MHPDSPSWIAQLDPKACGVNHADLLIRHQPSAPLQFLTDVLAVDAGHRNWTTAARGFLREGDFAAAAKCAQYSGDLALSDAVQAQYLARRKNMQQSLEDLFRMARDIERAIGKIPAIQEARSWLDLSSEILAQLPLPQLGMPADLLSVGPQPLADFEEAQATAQRQLALAQKESQHKQEERKRQIRELSRKANALADDLLLDGIQPGQAVQVERLSERARSAVREWDLDKLAVAYELLKRLSGGQSISDEDLGSESAPGPASEPGVATGSGTGEGVGFSPLAAMGEPELGGPRIRLSDLSDLVQQDLERAQGKNAPPVDIQPSDPLDFEKKGLEQQYAWAKSGAANEIPTAMSQYLLSWAKLNLLDRRYDRALTLFGDALRWLCLTETEKRARDVAMWGLLLSLAAPYLSREEKQSALTTRNLSSLCERKIGYFPLLRIEQMGLIPELAHHIVRLAWPAAGNIVRTYLLSYFGMRGVAATEFAAAVAETVTTRPELALPLLALLYDDQLPEPQLGNLLRQRASALPPLINARQQREFCLQLREVLLPYADDWELVASVAEVMQQQAKRLQQRQPTERSWRIVQDLLSPEVTLVEGARLLIRLRSEASASLRGVSTVARLLAEPRVDAKPFHGVLVPLEPLAVVEPNVVYERAIEICRFDEELCTSLFLEIQHSAHSEDGTERLLDARNRFFSLRLSPPRPGATPELNPYTFGLPIKNPNSIFGREQKINEICDILIGRDQDNAVLVHGDRKIGKTTLLTALLKHKRITSRYVPLSIDLEKIPDHCESTTFYFQYLVQPIQQKLREMGLSPVSCPEATLLRAPEQVFEDFFRQVDRVLAANNQRLLLVLDEFERVVSLVDQSSQSTSSTGRRGLGPEVLAALRAVIQPARCISLILAGVTYLLRRHTIRHNDRLARFGAEIELLPLDENGAELLVKLPPRGQYEVTPSAVELILKDTARQPYLIQKLCNHLYSDMVRCQSRLATAADVHRILERMARDAGGFVHLLEPIQSAQDFRLIQAMATIQSGRLYVRMQDLMRQLRREAGKSDEVAVRQRLFELAEHVPSVVERHQISPYQFRLTVGLFARFLRQQPESRAPFYLD